MTMTPEDWQRRCADADIVIENCLAAVSMIPIWALEKNQQWIPSHETIVLLKRMKDSLNDFAAIHYNGR